MNTVDPYPPAFMNLSQPQSTSRIPERPINTPLGDASLVTDGEFSLEDDAEEISLHMAHKAEEKLHSERKIRGENLLPAITAEAVLAYMEQACREDAQAKLDVLAAHILSGQVDPREAVAGFSESPSQQFLALQYVLQKGRQGRSSEELLAEIGDALAELEHKHGPAIRASVNTIDAAAAYAHDADDIENFQHTYQDVVLGEATLAKTLSIALARFGGQRVAEGLKGLVQALGLDVAANLPSTSAERLHALLRDMYHLEIAVTILERCHELADILTASANRLMNSERLMQDVISISGDKWVSESRFSGLTDEHGVQRIPDRIAFLAGVRSMLKDLPVQIYPDDEIRTSVLEAAQDALDTAIDQEPA